MPTGDKKHNVRSKNSDATNHYFTLTAWNASISIECVKRGPTHSYELAMIDQTNTELFIEILKRYVYNKYSMGEPIVSLMTRLFLYTCSNAMEVAQKG